MIQKIILLSQFNPDKSEKQENQKEPSNDIMFVPVFVEGGLDHRTISDPKTIQNMYVSMIILGNSVPITS